MKRLRPYISIDIQTTGRDIGRSDVLEFAFVLDDLSSPINDLAKYNFILKLPFYSYSEAGAMNLHQRLIVSALDPKIPKITPREAFHKLHEAITWAAKDCYKWDEKNFGVSLSATRVCLAGKNVSNFIVPVLMNFFIRNGVDEDKVKELFGEYVSDRFVDVGSLYYYHFGFVPSVEMINQLLDRPAPSHVALGNALDNVFAIRSALGITHGKV